MADSVNCGHQRKAYPITSIYVVEYAFDCRDIEVKISRADVIKATPVVASLKL